MTAAKHNYRGVQLHHKDIHAIGTNYFFVYVVTTHIFVISDKLTFWRWNYFF